MLKLTIYFQFSVEYSIEYGFHPITLKIATMTKQLNISLIAAMDENQVIGFENKLPWKLPADMKWFRKNTLGKTILMGRKTFESLGSKPLPDRSNIIVTRNRNYNAQNCYVAYSFENAVDIALQQSASTEIMIIGGASFYEHALPFANKLYVTVIHHKFLGDSWFPQFNRLKWKIVSQQDFETDEKNHFRYSFIVYERKELPLEYK